MELDGQEGCGGNDGEPSCVDAVLGTPPEKCKDWSTVCLINSEITFPDQFN